MNHWIISYRNFDVESVRLRETLFTLGNGYFSTRGAHEDHQSENHYPGTYFAGIYNRLASTVSNQNLVNEDLVNLPNWLPITFKIDGEEWFDINNVVLLSYCEMLHLKKGIVKRTLRFKDENERVFVINSIRFVSQHNPHFAGIRYSITSENWEGRITIRSSLIGDVTNNGVPRYRELNNQHLEILKKGALGGGYIYLQARTNQSHVEVAEVVKTEIYRQKNKLNLAAHIIEEEKDIHQEFSVQLVANEKISVTKLLSIYSSKDHAISENLTDALNAIQDEQVSFSSLLTKHMISWKHLWDRADIEIETQSNEQQLVRMHIFHALQSLSKHSINRDYGIPARGLHGEAYRGHVFWDELFILPFFIFNFPEVARSLLMYRYHRLNAARKLARESGYDGAMFPWQSASNGEEETQKFHLNPHSCQWGPDLSRYQRHVNMAIVYNIWNYYLITDDIRFLSHYGAELILEIAKFISSMVVFNPSKDRYEINGVMGPDEYHERYPNTEEPGLNNNAYTNVMAVWVLERALELRELLSKKQLAHLYETLNINEEQLNKWQSIVFKMFIPFHNKLLCQFEGYERLKEFDWDSYQQKYPNMERLDRILKAEKQDPNEYQIAKQPDALMLFYLLEEREIQRIFHQLGYHYDESIRDYTIQYYLQRTSHGSTLSKITFASMLFKKNPQEATRLYQEALISDFKDTQGGTTQEGIHLGVMVGTLSVLFKEFSGLKIKHGLLSVNPQLPEWITRLKFKIGFRGNLYEIEILPNACYIHLCEKYTHDSHILVHNEFVNLYLDKPLNVLCKESCALSLEG